VDGCNQSGSRHVFESRWFSRKIEPLSAFLNGLTETPGGRPDGRGGPACRDLRHGGRSGIGRLGVGTMHTHAGVDHRCGLSAGGPVGPMVLSRTMTV
jgi:hypothetical protein